MTKKRAHKPDIFKIEYIENHPWTKDVTKSGFGVFYKFTDEDEFTLESFYPLTRREGQDQNAEPDFIHWGIIDEMKRLTYLGFRFIWRDVK